MLISFINALAGDQGTSVVCSNGDATYVAANIQAPERRGLPARSLTAVETTFVFTLPAARKIDLFHVARANFTTFRVEGHTSNTWGSPVFTTGNLTIRRNPLNFLLQHTVRLFGGTSTGRFNYPFLRLVIPQQVPIAVLPGMTPLSVFSVGGVWGGVSIQTPTGFPTAFEHSVVKPLKSVGPDHEGWRQISQMSNPLVRLRMRRRARMSHDTPFAPTDEVVDWLLNVDANTWGYGPFCLFEDYGTPDESFNVPTMGWIVQALNTLSEWVTNDREPEVVENPEWNLEEVVGP